MSSLLLAYLAGVVTILSPCILPLLPIVLGGAVTEHRRGPLALAAGLVLSFTLIATLGFALGLTPKLLNQIAAVAMIVFGAVMLSPGLQMRFAVFASDATAGLSAHAASYPGEGLGGQFALGAILGAVWTPCVGPTLGAAIALAAQGQSVAYAGSVMFAFAVGTVTPLLVLMTMTRDAVIRNRGAFNSASQWLKPMLGGLLIVVGLMFLTGVMSDWEAFLLERMPERLIDFIYGI